MNHDTKEALAALDEEITKARAKFPGSEKLLAALLEEVGELADELLTNRVDMTQMRREALQVACVAIRIADEIEGLTFRERALGVLASELGTKARSYLETRELREDVRAATC